MDSTLRSSKLMMAAMRLRSRLLRIDFGVRWRTPMNSSRDFGVNLGGVVEDCLVRNLSSFGSSQWTNFFNKLSNML